MTDLATNGDAPARTDVEKAKLDLTEIGSTGLTQYGGVLDEEFDRNLAGPKAIAVYREMTADPIVGGVLLSIDNLVRQVEWTFDPASDDPEDRRWAEFMDTVIADMSSSWSDTVSSIFTMLPYGFSYHETLFKRRNGEQRDGSKISSSDYEDGLIGWRKLPIRAQDSKTRWAFGDNGETAGMYQNVLSGTNRGERFIPIEKALLFRPGSYKDSPEGKSVLRSAYRPYHFKLRIEELEGIGIERDLAGMPVYGVPARMLTPLATPEEKNALRGIQELVRNIRRNSEEGMVKPLAWDTDGHELFTFELLSSGSRRQFATDQIISRKNQEIAITCLADWLMLGHDAVGSRALASPKIDMFTTALETWTKGVADVFNAHGTPRLMVLNGVPRKRTPQLRPSRVEQVDLTEFANAVATLVTSGSVVVDDDTENFVRAKTGLPAKAANAMSAP